MAYNCSRGHKKSDGHSYGRNFKAYGYLQSPKDIYGHLYARKSRVYEVIQKAMETSKGNAEMLANAHRATQKCTKTPMVDKGTFRMSTSHAGSYG